MSRKTLHDQNHLYRAAICKALYGKMDSKNLECSLKEALAVRNKKDVQAWYDRWPKESRSPIKSSFFTKLGHCLTILKRY